MTSKQEEHSRLIMKAYKIIYENMSNYTDPTEYSYLIAYNKKLDVIEILKKVCINDKIILHQNPVWPKIDDGAKIDYYHGLSHNEDYPGSGAKW